MRPSTGLDGQRPDGVRVVLDVNVLISAMLSRHGPPARLLIGWLEGAFELVISPHLMDELRRALAYPKLRQRIPESDAAEYLEILARGGSLVLDPVEPAPFASSDPEDDYLIALAAATGALLVTGDGHLLELADRAPIHTPTELVDMLALA